MSEKEFLYQMRLKIFQEADKKEIPIVLLCKNITWVENDSISGKREEKD